MNSVILALELKKLIGSTHERKILIAGYRKCKKNDDWIRQNEEVKIGETCKKRVDVLREY